VLRLVFSSNGSSQWPSEGSYKRDELLASAVANINDLMMVGLHAVRTAGRGIRNERFTLTRDMEATAVTEEPTSELEMHMFVWTEKPTTFIPQWRATITSAAVDIPTQSAPIMRRNRCSAACTKQA